ncbi:LIC_10190 family membrane protein [Flavobacterium hydatis]|uniref:DUF8201 domain-containing protein n=1 Tax=Flavobacterium hydatis TaxID=991 RepID=A0A086AAW5_FLAHY|nr:hypothetical protein [Flavobacterium hydatis]KFF13829.1 hypothetical protein IW20_17285 [Flavobacterium hydatis]OXA89912.1 hypothetical protein B0A62_20445 [Flavobacterium hydatis]
MILILLSWIYILFTTINLGLGTDKILRLKNSNFIILSILGLFTTTILASIWAVFGRINIEFQIFLLVINIGTYLRLKNDLKVIYTSFFKELQSLDKLLKIALIIITVLILAQCASIPYIIDNESYYIQTIKWINEYGFVKGLANLHLFLAQTSGWHITQSVFNFSFLYDKFNDLSGFCLLLGNIYAISHLNYYFKNKEINYLVIGLLPLANLFFFSFISSPSPDLPIYILSLIVFFSFLNSYKNVDIGTFNTIFILVIFAIYIKTTAIALFLIVLLLFIKHYKLLIPQIAKPLSIGLLVFSLFLIKNTIISGYPLFPITLNIFHFDFQIPASMAHFYYDETKRAAFSITQNEFDNMGVFEIFKTWISRPALHGFFNKIIVLLLIIMPFFIFKFFNKKAFWILYGVFIFQLILLILSSPQYRFFMNFILLFSFLIASLILNNRNRIILALYISLLILTFIVIIPINLKAFTTNTFLTSNSTFSINNIFYPYKNSKFSADYKPVSNGNLQYNSPVDNSFFWGTGDGVIPCVNEEQIKYFETYYKITPQMRTTNLKDGFYAKNISNESN